MVCLQAAEEAAGGWRQMEPARDLGTVADLIADAFAQDMDERGRAALREMRWMSRLSPLVWWLSQTDPGFRDAFSGFVWQVPAPPANGEIVGNVNLNRAPGRRGWYIICNVVVRQDYRRRGIGRCLTEQAIAQAEELAADGVVLQVRQDNAPAMRLYADLGFRRSGGEVELSHHEPPSVAIPSPAGYRIRPWRPADGEAVYQLAQRAVPEVQQWLRPVRRETYAPGPGRRLVTWLGDRLAGRRTYRLLALGGGRPVAMLQVQTSFRGQEHRLALLVDPEHAGQVEAALAARGLHMLAALPPAPVGMMLYVEQAAALKVFRGYGFREERTLLTLKHEL